MHTDLDIFKSGVNGQARQAVSFLCYLTFIIFLTSVFISDIFKNKHDSKSFADDSLIVWTLQNSFMQEARFVQSQFSQAVFRRAVCKIGTANKKLIFLKPSMDV